MVIIRGQAVDALTPRIIPRGLFYFNRVPLTKQECSRWISESLRPWTDALISVKYTEIRQSEPFAVRLA
ncbi:hypothetical protein CSV72_15290 [Sporosarcina sp. P20a]|nr:hypothetical protein CSV72_15290 [Sporosarcina sp. P20a]